MIVCTKCKKEFDVRKGNFYVHTATVSGYNHRCITCYGGLQAAGRLKRKLKKLKKEDAVRKRKELKLIISDEQISAQMKTAFNLHYNSTWQEKHSVSFRDLIL